jgi:hypothetical protein
MVMVPPVKQLSERTRLEQAAGRRARAMHMLEQMVEMHRRSPRHDLGRARRIHDVASLAHRSEGRLEILIRHSLAMDRSETVAVIDGEHELAEPSDIFPSPALVAQLMLVFG